jgi:hypothetical protein
VPDARASSTPSVRLLSLSFGNAPPLRDVLLGRELMYTGSSIKTYLANTGSEFRPSQMTGKAFEGFRGAVTEVMRGFGLPER